MPCTNGQDLHRVWIFTSEHNPSGGDPGAQEKILRKAQDCADNGIGRSPFDYYIIHKTH